MDDYKTLSRQQLIQRLQAQERYAHILLAAIRQYTKSLLKEIDNLQPPETTPWPTSRQSAKT